jgi:hypothetical protein
MIHLCMHYSELPLNGLLGFLGEIREWDRENETSGSLAALFHMLKVDSP